MTESSLVRKTLSGRKCPICGNPMESAVDMARHTILHSIKFNEKDAVVVEFGYGEGDPSEAFNDLIRTQEPSSLVLRFLEEADTRCSHYRSIIDPLADYVHEVLGNVYAIPAMRQRIDKCYGGITDFQRFIYVSADLVVRTRKSGEVGIVGGFMNPDFLAIVLDIGSLFLAEIVGSVKGARVSIWRQDAVAYALLHELVHRLYKLYKHGKRFRMVLRYLLRLYRAHVREAKTIFGILADAALGGGVR